MGPIFGALAVWHFYFIIKGLLTHSVTRSSRSLASLMSALIWRLISDLQKFEYSKINLSEIALTKPSRGRRCWCRAPESSAVGVASAVQPCGRRRRCGWRCIPWVCPPASIGFLVGPSSWSLRRAPRCTYTRAMGK